MKQYYFLLWAVMALYMFATAHKTGKICYLAGILLTFMSVWYALNSFTELSMFSGTLGIIFKCVIGAFLLIFIISYLIGKKNSQNKTDK